jgi:ketosteroid isomerase-like protein
MAAVQAGDLEAARGYYALDATLWYNVSGETLTVEQHFKKAETVHRGFRNLRYDDIRVRAFTGGYVQQHRVLGELADGSIIDISVCLVVEVTDGKICHRDEYLDGAAIARVQR